MEIMIAVFLGAWLVGASMLGIWYLKKEYKDILEGDKIKQ